MVLVELKSGGRLPAGRQIVTRIQTLIQEGHLNPGESLPSTRRLGEQLGLHRSTIARAYQELWALGWLELRVGARPRVRHRANLKAAATSPTTLFQWDERMVVPPARPMPLPAYSCAEAPISFNDLGMDSRLMPVEPLARSLKAVLRRKGAQLLDYGDPQGLLSFRECLSHRMAQHGITACSGEILVTQGAQQALDLAMTGLTRPGDAILVESPTYNQMLKLLALRGVRPLAIPAEKAGLDLAALEALIKKERPALIYTMPSFQNPTGRSLSQAQREGLLALCEQYALPILEDGFEEEMTYFGRPLLPLKSMDRSGLVLYSGTFSKVLSPGLRMGWLVGSRAFIETLATVRQTVDLGTPPLLQAALEDFIRKGHFDQHLARLHRAFRRRMTACLTALRRELDPEQVRWDPPLGGYLVWLKVEGLPSSLDLEEALLPHGLQVRSGAPFFIESQKGGPYLRLSISNLDELEIARGVARLGAGLRALKAAHPLPL